MSNYYNSNGGSSNNGGERYGGYLSNRKPLNYNGNGDYRDDGGNSNSSSQNPPNGRRNNNRDYYGGYRGGNNDRTSSLSGGYGRYDLYTGRGERDSFKPFKSHQGKSSYVPTQHYRDRDKDRDSRDSRDGRDSRDTRDGRDNRDTRERDRERESRDREGRDRDSNRRRYEKYDSYTGTAARFLSNHQSNVSSYKKPSSSSEYRRLPEIQGGDSRRSSSDYYRENRDYRDSRERDTRERNEKPSQSQPQRQSQNQQSQSQWQTDSQSHSQSPQKSQSPNPIVLKEKLLHIFDDDFENKPEKKEESNFKYDNEFEMKSNNVKNKENKEAVIEQDSNTILTNNETESSETKLAENLVERDASFGELKKEESFQQQDQILDTPPKLERNNTDFDEANLISNSSLLSPVGDSGTIDDAFFVQLDPIKESKEYKGEDVSDAETIYTTSPPRVNRGRRLVRKLEFDSKRRKLKRIIDTDEEESDEEEEEEEEEDLKLSPKKQHVEPEISSDHENEKLAVENTKLTESEETTHKMAEDVHQPQESTKEKQEDFKESSSKQTKRPYKLKRDSTGRSLLQRACGKGSLSEVKSYIEQGADPNEADYCGFTCLHEAALEGHSKVVEYLINNGADVNKQALKAGDLETPLIDAAENKHLDTVKVLLDNGADPRVYNLDGFTALTKIFNDHDGEDGYGEIIKVLEEANVKFVDKKADKKVESAPKIVKSKTGLNRIIEDPNDLYFSELLKRKNIANSIYKYAAEGLKEFTANYFVEGGSLNHKPDILILAARNGHLELVDIILGLNPGLYDIDQQNSCGLTALVASVGRGHTDIVEFLLSKGADPSMVRKQDGLSCLEIAKGATHYDINEIKILQKYLRKSGSEVLDDDEGKEETGENTEEACDHKPKQDKTDTEKQAEEEFKQSEPETKKRKSISTDGLKEKKVKIATPPKDSEHKMESTPTAPGSPVGAFSKEGTPKNPDELIRGRQREATQSPKSKRSRSINSTSPAPSNQSNLHVAIPLTKEQEELKAKSAEEARLWQEKAEAKKRARRDMFLKVEKEKERKKKELEERKAKEEEEQCKARIEKEKLIAIVKANKVQELTKQRKLLERNLIIQNYPVGLQTAKFAGELLTRDEIAQYCPIYVFQINEIRYVVDLQIALLTSTTVSRLVQDLPEPNILPINSIQKSKIWSLFFPMVGMSRSQPFLNIYESSHDGHKKFKNLLLNFVELSTLGEKVKVSNPSIFELLEREKLEVDLDTLLVFSDNTGNCNSSNALVPSCGSEDLEIAIDSTAILKAKFVPPKLRSRTDVLKTIHNRSRPFW